MSAGIAMITGAGYFAETIPTIRDFTRGLMGVFVCWIPQIATFVVARTFRGDAEAGTQLHPLDPNEELAQFSSPESKPGGRG